MINEGIVKWKVLSSSRSVYISIFSIWKSIQSFIFCSAPGLTVAFDKRTNVQKPRKPQPHVAESSIFPRWFFFFLWVGCRRLRGVPQWWFIGYVASASWDTVATAVKTWYPQLDRCCNDHLLGWGFIVEMWCFLSQEGAMLTCFFSTSGSYCTGEISGVQMFNDLRPNKMISLGSHSWIMTPIKSHLSPLICNSYSSCSCT